MVSLGLFLLFSNLVLTIIILIFLFRAQAQTEDVAAQLRSTESNVLSSIDEIKAAACVFDPGFPFCI